MTLIKSVIIIWSSLMLCAANSYSQTTENGGWFFLSHTQALSKKVDFLADVQLRSANRYDYLSTLLLRGALSYNFNKHHAAAAGYTYKGDWEKEGGNTSYQREHRLFEQYMLEFKLENMEMSFRARLEQRFVKEDDIVFSQRARALLSAQVPLLANIGFTKGIYAILQNELFVNVQHKEAVNNNFLDQNRPYIAIGYRWSKKIDSEIGYMRWFQREDDGDYLRNIVQLSINTNF